MTWVFCPEGFWSVTVSVFCNC